MPSATTAPDQVLTETDLPPKAQSLLKQMYPGLNNSFEVLRSIKVKEVRIKRVNVLRKDTVNILNGLLTAKGIKADAADATRRVFLGKFDKLFKGLMS